MLIQAIFLLKSLVFKTVSVPVAVWRFFFVMFGRIKIFCIFAVGNICYHSDHNLHTKPMENSVVQQIRKRITRSKFGEISLPFGLRISERNFFVPCSL